MKRHTSFGVALVLAVASSALAEPPAETVNLIGVLQAREQVDLRCRVSTYVEKVHFEPGTMVKKGDLLYTLDARLHKAELAKAEAELTLAAAQLKLHAQALTRLKDLSQKGVISKEEYDNGLHAVTAAEAKLKTVQGAVERAKIELDYTHIRAPFDGRIDRNLVSVGNLVKADETLLASVAVIDPLVVEFDCDETTVARLQKALGGKTVKEAQVTLKVGLATDKEPALAATLESLATAFDVKTHTLRARAVLPNPGGKLHPGQFVRVRLQLPAAKSEK